MFTLTNISLVLFVTTAFNIVACFISWQRVKARGGLYFAVGMTGVALWTLAVGLDYASIPILQKVFFAKIEYTGYNIAFAGFALFALFYAGYERWLRTAWVKGLFGVIPLANILLALTNDWHRWLWSGFVRSDNNTVIFEHGPGYIFALITGYLMLLAIIVPLWQSAHGGSEVSRRQARLLFAASLMTVFGNILYLMEPPVLKGVDWTPISASVSGILFLLALYGTRLLDIAPIARDQLVSSLSDGMIVLDPQNRIIDLNQAAASMMGVPLQNLIGKNLIDLTPLSNTHLNQPLDQEIKTEVETGVEIKRYFDVLLSPLHDDRKNIIGRLMIFRDITHRKENELRLLQLTQAVEQSPTSVMITDLNGNITYVNPYFTVLTGYSQSEVIGKNPDIAQSGFTPDEIYRDMWHSIQSGQTWHGEFLSRKKNGDLYWENVVMAPVMDPEGRILNFIAVKEDITKRKRAEDNLRSANQQLENRLKEIELLQASLREQVIRDPLTQLYNRRFLIETIEQEFQHAKRASESLSIILFDVDHFKLINDTYGHGVGDECLVALANLLQPHVRKADIFCRYGGEEFMLVLPATDFEGAAQYAEKLRNMVANNILTVDEHQIKFTISLGVSSYPIYGTTLTEIINQADDAMYRSKRAGRNRVTGWLQ